MTVAMVANRGAAAVTSVGTSAALSTFTSPEAIARFNTVVLVVAVDNSGAAGAAPTLGVTDPRGNTWTSLGSSLSDPGIADEGVFVQAFATLVETVYQAGDVLTLTASPATGRAAYLLREFSGVDYEATAAAAAVATSGTSSTPSVSITPPAAGQLVIGAVGSENNANPTSDADTTDGAWQSIYAASSNSGTPATSVNVGMQHKVVTGPGAQTYNPVLGASVDWAALAVVLLARPAAALLAAYDPVLARVTLTVSGLNPLTASTLIYRWEAGEPPTVARATVVRGSDLGAATSGIVHDYEFAAGQANRYALYSAEAGGGGLDVVDSSPLETTPALDAVWLKSVARPFLNRTVTVTDFSDVTRPARGEVVDVLGRRLPVAVTQIRGSRQYELSVRAADAAEVDALALFLSFGDTLFVHVPGDCVVPSSGHFYVGDVTERRPPRHDSRARYFALPLTEVDAPDPSVVGYTVTWAGVTAAWASWAALLADAAVPTWLDLTEYVSAPVDEVVG